MKKGFLRIFTMFALMFAFTLGLTGCFEGAVTSISVVENSYQTTYDQNETPSFDGMKITATFENGSTKEITYPAFTVGVLNTQTPGDKEITISYKEVTTTITITVVEVIIESETLIGYETPSFLVTYTGNIATQTNKETEFMVRDYGYTVGDDNGFVIMPKMTVIDEQAQTYIVTDFLSNFTVKQWIEGQFVELTGEDLTAMVAIDSANYSFDFTQAAIGEKFELSLSPVMNANVDESLATEVLTLVVNVIDGWNAYTAADLSRLDNTSSAWTDYKNANNIGTEAINALILHRDITLTNNDMPASYFHKVGDADVDSADLDYAYISENNGSIKDQIDVYKRTLSANQNFDFIGNYFTIDASAVSLITRDNGQKPTQGSYVVPNTGLFDFTTQVSGSVVAEGTSATMQSINLIGNASRSAGEENIDRIGGLIMLDSWNSKDLTLDNLIAKSWITTFRITNIHENALISNTKAYDSYSTSIYLWNVGDNTSIATSEFKRSGGPLFMLTDSTLNDGGANLSNLHVDEATVLENFVSGQEPWFTINGANSIVTNIVALNALIQQYSMAFGMPKTFVNENGLINFISVIVPANALTDSGNVLGRFDYGNYATDMSDVDVQTLLAAVGGAGAPIFQAGGKEVFFNGVDQLMKLTQTGPAALDVTDAALFTGDIMNIFAKAGAYLGVTLGYMDYLPA